MLKDWELAVRFDNAGYTGWLAALDTAWGRGVNSRGKKARTIGIRSFSKKDVKEMVVTDNR